ncbi:unnamed protein product [Didymodactylos carnosus]|uniref:5'-nucleotidase n=1 Tax=Didymodactylos carnosus TaxID=1234261 RepID=A0A815ARY7_9BILA|nr:unnamed protein product [Didymodactylos carnosus]CAF1261830.1 unnamed protein product [Didymodactylos carnosus]CAF3741370.1 unnamed protein product [Didymodactylos carnosus]CAF4040327.1 unnamed protein product [Didymodactylos carnosus]
MGCRSSVQISVWQIILLFLLFVVLFGVGIAGWFRSGTSNEITKDPEIKSKSNWRTIKNYSYVDDIGYPPIVSDPSSNIQWTFLQMNDVYEMIPLNAGKKGGLARVATIRKLLLKENPDTITFLAGDIVSPSAIGNSIVDGAPLNGKQMIASFNVLGVDYATLGNHEFDIKMSDLRQRLTESNFTWISTNVYELNTTKPFHNVLPYKVIQIKGVKILIIGLTIDDNQGVPQYVSITPQQSLSAFVAQYIKYLKYTVRLTWNVLVCLTHLNMQNDIDIVEKNLEIDVVLGGHEHENYYLQRGARFTPIYKADDNAFSVFIHRFAYNIKTNHLLIYSTLTRVTPKFSDDETTSNVTNYYFQAGLEAFRKQGFEPERIVCVLPPQMVFDGRSTVIRAQQSLLTDVLCKSMIHSSNASVCIFNSGAIRLDDTISGVITQYDILRCLPFPTDVIKLNVPGNVLNQVLNRGLNQIHTGMFISYNGLLYNVPHQQWLLESTGENIDNPNFIISVATIPYFHKNTELRNLPVIGTYDTQTHSLISYLEKFYGKRHSTLRL